MAKAKHRVSCAVLPVSGGHREVCVDHKSGRVVSNEKLRSTKKPKGSPHRRAPVARKSERQARMARAAGGGDTYYCVPQVAGSGQDCYRDRVTAVKHLLSIRDHHRRNPEKLFTPVWNAKANKWDLKPCMSDKCGPGAWTEAKIRTVKSRRDPSWLD